MNGRDTIFRTSLDLPHSSDTVAAASTPALTVQNLFINIIITSPFFLLHFLLTLLIAVKLIAEKINRFFFT